MEMTISALTVNAVLNTVREISGPQYDRLLDRAGWGRFRTGIPSGTADLIATREELEGLFTNVYTLLGEELMRLFLRNYGGRLAAHIQSRQALQLAAVTISPEQQVAWFVQEIAQISTRNWTPATISEDFQAYYLTFDRCPLCAGIHGARAPICATMEALYGQLAQQVLHHRLRVVEVECVATGAGHCKIAIYKNHQKGASA
jgi:predicted hydrocarbon binding protein